MDLNFEEALYSCLQEIAEWVQVFSKRQNSTQKSFSGLELIYFWFERKEMARVYAPWSLLLLALITLAIQCNGIEERGGNFASVNESNPADWFNRVETLQLDPKLSSSSWYSWVNIILQSLPDGTSQITADFTSIPSNPWAQRRSSFIVSKVGCCSQPKFPEFILKMECYYHADERLQ
jgi:hypothetical protein